MLRSVNEIINYVIEAEDGEIGRCKDFLFDDLHWAIGYMVADTRKGLPGRKVLVSPIALGEPDWQSGRFPVMLTRRQIEESPPLDEDQPVSRQYETRWFDYFGWPYYWYGGGLWAADPYPAALYAKIRADLEGQEPRPEESHVRSLKEVTGYHIQPSDGEIGHVEDFIVEEQPWVIRYIVVDTKNVLPGRKVLVSPGWIDSVDWGGGNVGVKLTVNLLPKMTVGTDFV
jgi:hypothetical protein